MAEFDKNEAYHSPMEVVFSWATPENECGTSSKRKSQDDSGYVSPFVVNKRQPISGTPLQSVLRLEMTPSVPKNDVRKHVLAHRPESEGTSSYSEWDESLYSEPMELDTPCFSNSSQEELKGTLAVNEVSKDINAAIASYNIQTPRCSPPRNAATATPRKCIFPKKRTTSSAPSELCRKIRPRRNLTGVEKVDFLYHFGVKAHFPDIVSKIVDHLSDSDLSNVTMVSKTWKAVCLANAKAHERWRRYTEERKQNRENLHHYSIDATLTEKKPSLGERNQNHSTPFCTRQPTSPPCSPNRARFNSLCKVSSNLKGDEVLIMCPECRRPYACAASSLVAECTSRFCLYKFCRICKSAYHPNRDCPFLSPSTPTTPTKRYDVRKIRRNLRRL